ncbi:MAG: ferrous iron transport protein B [Lachnospiraceae bacterium]
MTLRELEIGETARVDLVGGEGELRRHFLDMGLTPGVEVTLHKVAPMGDPMELLIRDYMLTLRLDDAEKIEVTRIQRKEKTPAKKKHEEEIAHPGCGENQAYHPRRQGKVIADGHPITFALAGNQNCGKTTLFNQLTGANQHVGNFPGVTVDRKDGHIRKHPEATVVDLPGIYSISPYTQEEIVTRDFLLNERPQGIINIVDGANIERNLYLTLQLMELNIPMVLAINMMDEVRANGGTIDVNRLESLLGIPVVPISAAKNEGINELIEHAIHVAKYRECPGRVDFCSGAVHRCIHAMCHMIEDHAQQQNVPVRFAATKVVEGDQPMLQKLSISENEQALLDHAVSEMEKDTGMDREAALADMRYHFIEEICSQTVIKPQESKEHIRSEKADRILTNKYLAIPTFIGIMGLVFWLTFGVIGSFLDNLLSIGIDAITAWIDKGLTVYGINPVVKSLVVDGICSGVGSVLSFLPTIVTLFFFLSILEDSGYMARVAFVMDKLLRKIGLSGRSIVSMLIGFGCSVPAIMSTRTLSSDRDRKMTVLLTPFMSCSAKLPIYAMFTLAFFPHHRALVMIGLYVGGMAIGILVGLLLKKTAFRGEPVPFVMELPNYRMPSPKSVLHLMWEKAKDFLVKAFTVIFVSTIIIWFLQTFDTRLNVTANSEQSLLACIGALIAPILIPLGLGDWRIATALITGFTAKESVVSTLAVLTGSTMNNLPQALGSLFSSYQALVFLTFVLLYTPCVATMAAVKREMGKKMMCIMMLAQCSIAWMAAFLVHLLGMAMGIL